MDPATATPEQMLMLLLERAAQTDTKMQQLMGIMQSQQTEVATLRASHAAMQTGMSSAQSAQPAQPEALFGASQRDPLAEAVAASRSRSRLPSQLKVQPLRLFSGVRGKSEDLAAWVFQAEQMFLMADVDDDEMRVAYAGQALTDHAATWFFSRRKDGAPNRLTTWEAFKAGLRSQFQGTDTYKQAKDRLYGLTQGKDSLQKYTDQFLQLHTIVGDLSERELMFLYERGLKPALQREVLRSDPKSFSEMLELVERLENIFSQTQSDWKPARPLREAPDPAASQAGQAPMELGAMQHGRPQRKPESDRLPSEEHKRRMEQNLCYGCGKAGHIRRDCRTNPSKPKPGPGNGLQPAQGGR